MDNKFIKIQNHEITVKEYNGQRVVTLKDIDIVHERPDGTARRNFNSNKKRFVEKEDFFVVGSDEIRTSHLFPISDNDYMDKILITESGYLMLVKSFTDDLAWQVQRQLVKSYFSACQSGLSLEGLSVELQAVIVVDKRVTKVEQRVDKLENNMTITHEQIQIIKNRVNKKVTALLGGYESNAYKDKHLRGKAYSRFNKDYCDYFRINARANTLAAKFDEALGYIDMWEPDTNLRIQINDCNTQMNMEVA